MMYSTGCMGTNGRAQTRAQRLKQRRFPRTGRSHVNVPRRVNLAERFQTGDGAKEFTTIMIRNVPNRYDRDMLMQELDDLGLAGTYDFLYLPIDNCTMWNVGYAFVNFNYPKDAHVCMEALQGYQFSRFCFGKVRIAHVSVAHIQGLQNNL